MADVPCLPDRGGRERDPARPKVRHDLAPPNPRLGTPHHLSGPISSFARRGESVPSSIPGDARTKNRFRLSALPHSSHPEGRCEWGSPSVPLRSDVERRDAATRDPAPPVPLRRGAKWYTFVLLSFRITGGREPHARAPRPVTAKGAATGSPPHGVSSRSDLNETQRHHATHRREQRCAARGRPGGAGPEARPFPDRAPGLPPPEIFPLTHHAARFWLAYRHKVSPRCGPPQPSPRGGGLRNGGLGHAVNGPSTDSVSVKLIKRCWVQHPGTGRTPKLP